MADNKRIYQIQINGVQESTNAVEALNKQLEALERRIKDIESKNVKLDVGGGTASTSKSGVSDEAISKQKEMNSLKKEELATMKALQAQERLTADAYSNTMQGMKQNLADLKAVINATDLGDSDNIKKMSQDANELTNKLKKMEEAYGQFGRNVGNYANGVAAGLQKVLIKVGDTERTFDNAKQAAKTLGNELKTMAVNGQQGTKAFQDLQEAVAQLNSDIKDASVSSKAMDNLLDTMQSFAAIGTISTGLSSLFGIDDSEIEKSIQKMVAFQNVLKGIETINKQIQTREGVGGWIAPFTKQIDKATTKLLAFNTALLGTSKAAKVAAVGIKAVGTALKSLMTLGIVAIISVAIEKVMDLIESFNKLSDAEQAQKDSEEAMAEAYGKGMAKLTQYKAKLDSFNGSKKEEKKLVEELNKEFGETLGTYKSVAEWQDVLKKKGEVYIKTLQLQAQAQAVLNSLTAAYAKLQQIDFDRASGEYDKFLNKMMNLVGLGKVYDKDKQETEEYINFLTNSLSDIEDKLEKHNKDNKLGNYAPQVEKNTDKTKKALEDEQKTLNQLELKLMKEGLNKKLKQLDEEERQTINKLKENGRKNASIIKKVEQTYAEIRKKEIDEYLKTLSDSIMASSREISQMKFSLNLKDFENQIDELKNAFEELQGETPMNRTLTTRNDLRKAIGNTSTENRNTAYLFNEKKLEAEATDTFDEFYDFLRGYLEKKNSDFQEEFQNLFTNIGEEQAFSWLSDEFEEEYSKELSIVREYGAKITDLTQENLKNDTVALEESFNERLMAADIYYARTLQELSDNLNQQKKLREEAIEEQIRQEKQAEVNRYNKQFDSLSSNLSEVDRTISGFSPRNDSEVKQLEELKKKRDEIQTQIQQALDQHMKKMAEITDEGNNKIKKNEIDSLNEISSAYEGYFDNQLSNYRDFQSKLNDEFSLNPVRDKLGFGFINVKETSKNYQEIINASKAAISGIRKDKETLDKLYSKGFIKTEAYNATMGQLNDMEKGIIQGMNATAEASKHIVDEVFNDINNVVQTIGDSFMQIMQAVWDAQDYAFEKEQEELDKWNEKLDKALDEQQEIIEEHKNNIDSIEDELANARGGRREHLIDQLNAEIEAQREAQREEKRIQKEKEQAEKKQEALDKKRRKEEYDRNVMQAFVNWHLAIMNGLATQPFLYMGIAMGALATALGGVQYALIKSQKPYAKGGQLDGGVAQGNRHRDGGIKVLGGRAEIEGGEYITNRLTTSKNIDLLDYINSKKKKIDINDLMEFYSTTPRKTIRTVRTKFEDGGYMPTLPNTLDIKDQLQNIVINQDNRPVVVSVVDINNKQEDVRRVQTLAGLDM